MSDETEPCPHKVLRISDEDYERSEAICDACGVRMKNDRRVGWFAVEHCPTCSGNMRQTVGMVCQTCGTDYGIPAPSPRVSVNKRQRDTRDDAEKPRLTAEERAAMNCDCAEPYGWEDHVDSCLVPVAESILAAHMAAPDDVQEAIRYLNTLLRARENDVDRLIDERDALRERIRALAETWEVAPISNLEELRTLGGRMTGDRDTLTDEEREQINAAIRGGRGYYESTARTHAAVESIVAARVRAAQAQAWDEGWADGQTPFKYPRESNPWSDAGDEFQNPED